MASACRLAPSLPRSIRISPHSTHGSHSPDAASGINSPVIDLYFNDYDMWTTVTPPDTMTRWEAAASVAGATAFVIAGGRYSSDNSPHSLRSHIASALCLCCAVFLSSAACLWIQRR